MELNLLHITKLPLYFKNYAKKSTSLQRFWT